MAHKELKYAEDARRALEAGVDAVANAVKVTLGPKGRYVVIDKKFGAPTITNDGVTIAREIEVEDVFENQGAHELRALVLEDVLDLDLTGDGDAVVRDRRGAELLVDDDVAALGPERHLHGVRDRVHAGLEGPPRVLGVLQFLVSHGCSGSLFRGCLLLDLGQHVGFAEDE